MTNQLKRLLHDFGLLYVTIQELEKQYDKENKITFEDYNSSLKELLPGEPAIIVKINKNGKHEIYNYSENNNTNIKGDNHISILELPEDEFYFFEAFRLGIFNINQELPQFLFNMWIIHLFSIFEYYLAQILKKRLTLHPKLLSLNKTLTIQELLNSSSKEEIVERSINQEVRELMYFPIIGILEKFRNKYGFNKLCGDYDKEIQEISLIRNCLIHNGSNVDSKLADAFPNQYSINEKILINKNIVFQTIQVTRKLSYEIDKIYENI